MRDEPTLVTRECIEAGRLEVPELASCRWAAQNTKVATILHSSFHQEVESISLPLESGLAFWGVECRGCKVIGGLGLGLRRPYSICSYTLRTAATV